MAGHQAARLVGHCCRQLRWANGRLHSPPHSLQEVLRNSGALEGLLPLLRAGPESSIAISAARAVEGMCREHYINQNAAREIGVLAELTRLLGAGHEYVDMVAAAAGGVASLCSAGNATNAQAFK